MKKPWPKNDNIMSWDPENMQHYWELCSRFDQYPQLSISASDSESQQAFSVALKKTLPATTSR